MKKNPSQAVKNNLKFAPKVASVNPVNTINPDLNTVDNFDVQQNTRQTDNISTSSNPSLKKRVKYTSFVLLIMLGAILLPVLFLFAKLHIETQELFSQSQAELEIAKNYNTPNYQNLVAKLDEQKKQISPVSSLDKIYKTQSQTKLLTEETKQSTTSNQQKILSEQLDLFKKTLANTETLNITSYTIMKNVYVDFSAKPIPNMGLTEIDIQLVSLKNYQTQLEKELDEAKVSLLYGGLSESKNDVTNLREFLSKRGEFAEENKKLDEYLAKVDSVLALKENIKLKSEDLEKKIKTEVTPLLDLPKDTKQKIEEQEIARIQELSKTENGRRELAGLSPAPTAPVEAEKVIFISIARQEIFLYEKGQLIKSSFTVTGKPGFETVTGTYKIYAKQRNAVLRSPFENITYEVPVAYWMPFFSGYGLHDANWREVAGRGFGGNIYNWDGSHGCANLPTSMAAFIWNWAPIGTPVHVE